MVPSSAWAIPAALPPARPLPFVLRVQLMGPVGPGATAGLLAVLADGLTATSGAGDGDSAPEAIDAISRLATAATKRLERGRRIVIHPCPPAGPAGTGRWAPRYPTALPRAMPHGRSRGPRPALHLLSAQPGPTSRQGGSAAFGAPAVSHGTLIVARYAASRAPAPRRGRRTPPTAAQTPARGAAPRRGCGGDRPGRPGTGVGPGRHRCHGPGHRAAGHQWHRRRAGHTHGGGLR